MNQDSSPDSQKETNELIEDATHFSKIMPQAMRAINYWTHPDPLEELTLAQKRCLKAIHEGHSTVSQIAEAQNLTVSAATQTAKKLIEMNLIEHHADHNDARNKPLGVTEKGKDLLSARMNLQIERAVEVLGQFSPAERRKILKTVLQVALVANRLSKSPSSDQVFPLYLLEDQS